MLRGSVYREAFKNKQAEKLGEDGEGGGGDEGGWVEFLFIVLIL